MGIRTAEDLRRLPEPQLVQRFGERVGTWLYLASRGKVRLPRATVGLE